MSEIIIIAGPQGAGKSTVITGLYEQYQSISPLFSGKSRPLIFTMQETRQMVVHKNMLLGGCFMSWKDEVEVIDWDFNRMDKIYHGLDKILSPNNHNLVYIDECNIFTIAHIYALAPKFKNKEKEIKKCWDGYIDRLTKLNAKVIFLDVPPEISWERRHKRYEQRLVYFPKKKPKYILGLYWKYFRKLYGNLRLVYKNIPDTIPKVVISGQLPQKTVMENVCTSLAQLSDTFRKAF